MSFFGGKSVLWARKAKRFIILGLFTSGTLVASPVAVFLINRREEDEAIVHQRIGLTFQFLCRFRAARCDLLIQGKERGQLFWSSTACDVERFLAAKPSAVSPLSEPTIHHDSSHIASAPYPRTSVTPRPRLSYAILLHTQPAVRLEQWKTEGVRSAIAEAF